MFSLTLDKQEQACEEAHSEREAAHIQPGRRIWVGAVVLGYRGASPECAVSTSQHTSSVRQNAGWIRSQSNTESGGIGHNISFGASHWSSSMVLPQVTS